MARVLPRDEWDRLEPTGVRLLAPSLRDEDSEVLVIEDAGRIVATMGTYRVTHFEGLWIDPEYRGNAGLARRLMKAGIDSAKKWTDQWVWAASGNDHTDDLMTRMGGVKMPTDTFVIPISEESNA